MAPKPKVKIKYQNASWCRRTWLSTLSVNSYNFLGKNSVVICCLLHDYEFKLVQLLDWLLPNAGESRLFSYLTHIWDTGWMVDFLKVISGNVNHSLFSCISTIVVPQWGGVHCSLLIGQDYKNIWHIFHARFWTLIYKVDQTSVLDALDSNIFSLLGMSKILSLSHFSKIRPNQTSDFLIPYLIWPRTFQQPLCSPVFTSAILSKYQLKNSFTW